MNCIKQSRAGLCSVLNVAKRLNLSKARLLHIIHISYISYYTNIIFIVSVKNQCMNKQWIFLDILLYIFKHWKKRTNKITCKKVITICCFLIILKMQPKFVTAKKMICLKLSRARAVSNWAGPDYSLSQTEQSQTLRCLKMSRARLWAVSNEQGQTLRCLKLNRARLCDVSNWAGPDSELS